MISVPAYTYTKIETRYDTISFVADGVWPDGTHTHTFVRQLAHAFVILIANG